MKHPIHLSALCAGFLCVLLSITAVGQTSSEALFLSTSSDLKAEDVSDLRLQTDYTTSDGIQYRYYQQQLHGVPIYNAIGVIAERVDSDDLHVTTSFITDLKARRATATAASLTAPDAVRAAMRHSLTPMGDELIALPSKRFGVTRYGTSTLSEDGASASLVYMPKGDELVLTWQIDFHPLGGSDYWSTRVDAHTGALVDRSSYTTHCTHHTHHAHHGCHAQLKDYEEDTPRTPRDGSMYNVYALPAESPIHGPRQIVAQPADSMASPFGWHDENGVPGPEYNSTNGNNVSAAPDLDENFVPDYDVVSQSGLSFDYPIDLTEEPDQYTDAATVNLFYMANMMHDISYAYGFDEQAGNFQQNNYGRGGNDGDAAVTWAQYGGTTGSNVNNADFSTPPDGGPGRMRMFLWNRRDDQSVFSVTAPASVAMSYPARTAAFGATIDETPLVGTVVLADDNIGVPSDACQTIRNSAAINGNIALIDRGSCEFGAKILNAEQQGATGVIICNNVPGLLAGQMGAGAVGNQVTIPSVFISREDCAILRTFIGQGLAVQFKAPEDDGQATFADGSLDNGIIAHEYGHGISNRLTAGPLQAGCLGNSMIGTRDEGEQMGEGWSDYFTLITTVEPGDQGADPRGIGNFAIRQDVDGSGIRTFPYSTDLNVNPVTYREIVNASIPHGVGHVWCSMIWDMYWLFVDRYGWDADVIHGDGGNNLAIRLVMEGMKLQPCNPGFVDGRDAILSADRMLNGGDNQDIIWQAFARRGLGWLAEQGSSSLVGDGVEDFSLPPSAIKSVKIEKTMSPLIQRGDNIQVTLTIRNDSDDDAQNITVVDAIPDETDVATATLPTGAAVSGGDVTFASFDLAAGNSINLTYELETPDIPSILQVYDGFETLDGFDWAPNNVQGSSFFDQSDNDPISGMYSWEIRNVQADNIQELVRLVQDRVMGNQPMLRFNHRYATDAGRDGGIVEISTDFLGSVEDLGPHLIRDGYDSYLARNTFPDLTERVFSATSSPLRQTYIDLSDFQGEDINIQFRFASDANMNSDYWIIDDYTLFDARNYNSEVCMTYDGQSSSICTEAPEWGTIVEPEEFSSIENTGATNASFIAYPNPVRDLLTLSWQAEGVERLEIFDAVGVRRLILNAEDMASPDGLQISTASWAPGMHAITLTTEDGVLVRKVVKQ